MFLVVLWFVFTIVAIAIIPWNALLLVMRNPNVEYVTQGTELGSLGGVSFRLNMTAQGPFSAWNPITLNIYFFADSDLVYRLGSPKQVQVVLFDARAYPENVTNPSYPLAAFLLNPTGSTPIWQRSVQVIYTTAGNFDLAFRFLNDKMQTVAQPGFRQVISIASQDVTFSYVSTISFISLEIVIIAITLLELRAKDGHNASETYSETNIWKISRKGIYHERKVGKEPRQPNKTKRKEQK